MRIIPNLFFIVFLSVFVTTGAEIHLYVDKIFFAVMVFHHGSRNYTLCINTNFLVRHIDI